MTEMKTINRTTLPNTDVLVIGASVAGCGAVRALTKRGIRTAVLERAQMCAAEFADALYTEGDSAAYVPQTADGVDFAAELSRRGILSEYGICLPAVSPVISARFAECGAPLYAPGRITDITGEEEGYRVTFVSMGGEFVLPCGAILDTTASFVSGMWFGADRPAVRRMLGANVLGEGGTVHGGRPGETFFSVSVTGGDFDGAREELLRAAAEKGFRIITSPMTAAEAGESMGALCDTVTHLSSTSFGTVTASYDAGVRWGEAWTPGGTILPTKSLPSADGGAYDVIVCGGGTAGAVAALVAAREGGRVLLLEDGICLGGIGTVGGILYYYYGVAGGAYEEVDDLARALQKELPILPYKHTGDLAKRIALGRKLRGYGVTIRYESTAVGVLRDGSRITGVRYRTDRGISEARAAFVLDATADGWVLLAAGAQTMAGRASDGGYQPYSNVYTVFRESTGTANYHYVDNGIVDPYDPAAMGRAIAESGCDSAHLWEDYRGDRRYLGTAPRIGLREGRRIVGEETVRLQDLLLGDVSDKPLFWGYSNLDNHGKDNALEDSLCRRWNTVASMWGYNLTIPVPAGALIPRGMDGLLAACRALAVDHVVASAVRMKYDMQKCGEAAAVLAMEAIRRGCPARQVPYHALREKLLASGCLTESTVPAVVHIGEDRTPTTVSGAQMWRDDPAWLREALAGDQPGYAIWAASVHGAKLREMLVACLSSENENLRRHAALALGLAGCEGTECAEAIPHLLTMAGDKSGRTVNSGRKYNYPYALSAAVLLELLGVREAVEVLLPLAADPSYTDEIPFEKCELTEDRQDLAFQYFTQGFAALCGLYRRFPGERPKIAASVEARIFADDFRLRVTGKASDTLRIDYTEKIRTLWQNCRADG